MLIGLQVHVRAWFPILTGLASIVSHPHIDVRTRGLEQLFNVLKLHGSTFTPKYESPLLPSNTCLRFSCPQKKKKKELLAVYRLIRGS